MLLLCLLPGLCIACSGIYLCLKPVLPQSLQFIYVHMIELSKTHACSALLHLLRSFLTEQESMGWNEGVRAQRPVTTLAVACRLMSGVLGEPGIRNEVGLALPCVLTYMHARHSVWMLCMVCFELLAMLTLSL